jgi:hypothetical protein
MSDAKQSAAVTVPSIAKAVWQARIWAWFRTLTKRLLLANAWQASGKVFRQVTLATGVWIAHATGVEEETGMTWADDEGVSIEAPGPERPGVDAASDDAAGDDAADDGPTGDDAGREDDGELGRPSPDALGVGFVVWEDAEAPADTTGVAETGESWISCEEDETIADSSCAWELPKLFCAGALIAIVDGLNAIDTLELGLSRVLVDKGLPRASVGNVPVICPVEDSATETELPKGSVWTGTFRESIADEPDIKAADNDVMRVELPLISIEVANADPVESNELAVDA